ncbi:kinase-like protein [Desarmillaria tabescens]|uniref:Kinase-like protein n=1 Tax=Armillaria tabescens TaxID=1929756 RepID=A0AA39K6U5_ARMTA|nr:kinase-like protein [Desarmillaria tabescens]KAK0455646.1 kinase-like protein [Desarmillaria tabescens]
MTPISIHAEASNKHTSVGLNGEVYVDLTFASEPLGLPGQEGYGWPQLDFDEAIGPENRYVICRKLGWGMSSSTWLARDKMDNSYVALKILNGFHTELVERGRVWELEALQRISSSPLMHCLQLMSHFTLPGKGTAGQHLCLVTKVLGGDVKSLFEKHGIFPFPLAKRIILHLLRGIAHAHSRGVMHTDLKHNNIFFDTPISMDDFDKLLMSDPPRRHVPEASHDGLVEATVSQPLPIPTLQEAMQRTFVVADFGHAQLIENHTENKISPPLLCPPEIIIGGPWTYDHILGIMTDQCTLDANGNLKSSSKVNVYHDADDDVPMEGPEAAPKPEISDIWTFGCLIFELITGRALFKYELDPKLNLDEPNHILYQMLCYTCKDIRAQQLMVSALADQFFDTNCNLKAIPRLMDYPFEISIRSYKVIEEADVLSTAALMLRCLRLDPAQRASADELLSDPWFNGVE